MGRLGVHVVLVSVAVAAKTTTTATIFFTWFGKGRAL